jgi:uncharacterized protein (DUF305 family)
MKTGNKLPLALIALVLGLGLSACGDDETTTQSERPPGNGVDRASVAEMIPHHQSAVEMAEIARARSDRKEIKQLADAIISTQNTEIQRMRSLDQRLERAGIAADDLGMAAHEMGTDMDPEMLRSAEPFDREFIDAMIPHHQGAIRMARVELERGDNPELKRLAQAIVDAQSNEIDEMNMWRVAWYGRLSPAGGVPQESEHAGHGN